MEHKPYRGMNYKEINKWKRREEKRTKPRKMSLFLIKHDVYEAYGGMETELHTFLT
jgi:hypothetical protein